MHSKTTDIFLQFLHKKEARSKINSSSEDKYSSTDIEGMINKNIAQKGRRNMEKVKLPERELILI